MSLYYTPEHAKVGDVIPFFDRRSGRFENFYLKNWNPDAPREQVVHGWHRMSGAWPDRITETPGPHSRRHRFRGRGGWRVSPVLLHLR